MVICRLQVVERLDCKELLPIAIDFVVIGPTSQYEVFYMSRLAFGI